MSYIVIDQGTSSTKAFLFNAKGEILHQKKKKYKLETPKPFHIECNPKKILDDIVNLFNESPEFHEGILRDVQFRVNAVIDREFPKGITHLNKIISKS